MSVSAKVIRVTPRKAKEWLDGDDKTRSKDKRNNRSLSSHMVDRYAGDMKAGRWQLNGESVVFNGSALLDGQHRLHAVVKADVPVDMVIVRGIDHSAFKTIDSGAARTMGHVLQIHGHDYAFELAAALSMLFAHGRGNPFGGFGSQRPTKLELESLLERNKGLPGSVEFAAQRRTPLAVVSLVAFCHYVFSKIDKDAAEKFINDLCTGDGVRASSPVGILRDRLVEESAGGRRLDRRLVVYLIFRAWNATRTGEKLQRLLLPRSATDGGRVSVDLPDLV